jgi:arginase
MTNSNQPSLDVNLRLVWPQWQGAGTVSVQEFASEFPFDVGRRGYAVGSAVLEAVLPPHDGPTVTVPVSMTNEGLAQRDGVESQGNRHRATHPRHRNHPSTQPGADCDPGR